jgi:integrase
MTAKQIEHKHLEIKKMKTCIRMQGKALSTERGYPRWVGKYIEFICDRKWNPETTSREKVEAFLGKEADRGVAASTQNGAFAAILYYYEHIRKDKLEDVDALRAKVGERVRQAPSRDDVRKVLMAVQDSGGYPTRLITHVMYALGTRIGETLSIRIKEIDLESGKLTIIEGKNKNDRFLNIPPILVPHLKLQLAKAEASAAKFRADGIPIKLPSLMAKKTPKASFQRRWAWLFPLDHACDDPRGNGRVTWHCLAGPVRHAIALACERSGVEGITPHHFRHAWATHSADAGARLEDIQEILGHKDIKTTLRYIRPNPERVPSPLESLGIAI